MFHLEGSAD